MLVADVEASGVWRIAGGMAALAAALERRARASGVAFHFGCTVQKIETEGGKVSAVIDDRGERHACSAVIMNGDAAALADGLLGEAVRRASARVARGERSLSAITWCAVSESQGVALDHHTVFFSDDYAQEFVELAHGPARDPTVYVCEQGEGRKLLLVNAPATGQAAPADIDTRLTKRLARSGITINLQGAFRRDPKDFNAIYPATHGALYGRATHGWMSTFLRPQARSKVPGLYLAGGSAHPGPGVPMAALSGLRAAEALLQDHASMRR
jgi:1-hydroxycarotenoid 3,4-desaturase